jgi:catechol 2,3-dioxygenase-like lactoylglutathione lyase family enzyme
MRNRLLGPVRAVVVCVDRLDEVRPFYEDGLGFRRVDTVAGVQPAAWGLDGPVERGVRLAVPDPEGGAIDLIQGPSSVRRPLRDPDRPWDCGLLTLNVRVRDLDRALAHLRPYGAEAVSDPLAYEAGGTSVREVMVHAPGPARLTLLQAGPAEPDAPPIEPRLATVGVVVSDLERVHALFVEGLGWTERVAIDHTGAPFDRLLGAPDGTRLEMAVLAAGGHEDGKLEPLRIRPPQETPRPLSGRPDGTGLWTASLQSPDLEALAAQCRRFDLSVRGPQAIERPFVGATTALYVTLPGGSRLECLAT